MPDTIERLNSAMEGRYQIDREVGQGGMATVYLAQDLKHNRRVALKVLKPELAAVVGAERFLAEIETTANLQHPHILPLYDSGEADTFLFYVMPFVEGETLRERVDREKQLPVDEALRITMAVAGALDYAHRHGVVHRDIKPGNIMLQDGQPVVGDFGIALAVGSAGGARLTETGLSVGTPFYMSPEQATGDMMVGPATDTYALGAVLYELLTGDPPYMGNTAQAVLGKIIQGQPVSATAVRRSIPPNVDAAIRKALEKLPADRFTDAREFSNALANPAFRHGVDEYAIAGGPVSTRSRAISYAGWGVAAILAGLTAWGATRPEPVAQVKRFAVPFLPGEEVQFTGSAGFGLSADGRLLAYRLPTNTGSMLAIRRWDDLTAVAVRETGGAFRPSLSPEGDRLAFQQGGVTKVLDVAGGPVTTLGEIIWPRWGYDGYVYAELPGEGIVRVPATGGPPEDVYRFGEGVIGARPTALLPGGERALIEMFDGESQVLMVDLGSGDAVRLAYGQWGRYASSGHLVYEVDGTLMAAPLDARKMELTGPAVAVLQDVNHWELGQDGSLFYTTGAGGNAQTRRLVWVDRSGEVTPVDPDWTFDRGPDVNFGMTLSPEGDVVALRENTEDGYDIWVKRLDRGPRTRLTLDEGHDRMPTWRPGTNQIAFLSDRRENIDVWLRRADGTGEPELLLDMEASIATISWSPDGTWLLARTGGTGGVEGGRSIYGIRPGVDSAAVPLIATSFDEVSPEVSPDGRWIAYTSVESDRYEVFVRPFPNVDDGRIQVSVNGGISPRWSPDGDELFFQDVDENFVVVAVDAGETFRASPPRALFALPVSVARYDIELPYDIAPDDGRFIMSSIVAFEEAEGLGPESVLVLNFNEELKARVPVP